MAPGNHPTGINPVNFDEPGLKSITATAFWVPLQTNSLRPDLSKAKAFGLAPNKSAGLCRVQIVSVISSDFTLKTLNVSLPALATTMYLPFGESFRALAWRPVRISFGFVLSFKSIIETEPSFAMCLTESTLTNVPFPAGPVTELASGRRPPQLLTYSFRFTNDTS